MNDLYATLFEFWASVEWDDVQSVIPVKVYNGDGDFVGYRKEAV